MDDLVKNVNDEEKLSKAVKFFMSLIGKLSWHHTSAYTRYGKILSKDRSAINFLKGSDGLLTPRTNKVDLIKCVFGDEKISWAVKSLSFSNPQV